MSANTAPLRQQKEGTRNNPRPEIKPMSQINPPGGTTLPGQPRE